MRLTVGVCAPVFDYKALNNEAEFFAETRISPTVWQ
jgi:hypothetical protein